MYKFIAALHTDTCIFDTLLTNNYYQCKPWARNRGTNSKLRGNYRLVITEYYANGTERSSEVYRSNGNKLIAV